MRLLPWRNGPRCVISSTPGQGDGLGFSPTPSSLGTIQFSVHLNVDLEEGVSRSAMGLEAHVYKEVGYYRLVLFTCSVLHRHGHNNKFSARGFWEGVLARYRPEFGDTSGIRCQTAGLLHSLTGSKRRIKRIMGSASEKGGPRCSMNAVTMAVTEYKSSVSKKSG